MTKEDKLKELLWGGLILHQVSAKCAGCVWCDEVKLKLFEFTPNRGESHHRKFERLCPAPPEVTKEYL